jgi:hypothetical protein
VFAYLLRSARGAYAPKLLRAALPGYYQEPIQHDASEFLKYIPLLALSCPSPLLRCTDERSRRARSLSRSLVGTPPPARARYLLDQLETELGATPQKALVSRSFGGTLTNRIICSSCGHQSPTKVRPFNAALPTQ